MNIEGLKKMWGWNKGKKGIYSDETIKKMRMAKLGKYGELSNNYKDGKSRN